MSQQPHSQVYASDCIEITYKMDIVSITVTCELGIPINLNELAEKIREFDYTPDLFAPCGYLRDGHLKGNARIWKSGTIHIIARSNEDAKEDLNYIIGKLKDKMDLEIEDPVMIK